MKRYFMVLIVLALALAWGCGGGAENPTESNLRGLDGASAEGWSARFAPVDGGAAMILAGELEPGALGLMLTPPEGWSLKGGPVSLIEAEEPLILAGMQDHEICVALKSNLTEKTAVEAAIPLVRAKTVSSHRWPQYPQLLSWNFDGGQAIRWSFKRLRGDANSDGRVSGLDVLPVAVHFGEQREFGTDNWYVDLNGDNRIDGQDLFVIVSNYGYGFDGAVVRGSTAEHPDEPIVIEQRAFTVYGKDSFDEEGVLYDGEFAEEFKLHWLYQGGEEPAGSDPAEVFSVPDEDELASLLVVEVNAVSLGQVVLEYSYPANGDINGDGLCNGQDLFPITTCPYQSSGYNGTQAESVYARAADLNYDGWVLGEYGVNQYMNEDIYILGKLFNLETSYDALVLTDDGAGGYEVLRELDAPPWSDAWREADGAQWVGGTVSLNLDWQSIPIYISYRFFPPAERESGNPLMLYTKPWHLKVD